MSELLAASDVAVALLAGGLSSRYGSSDKLLAGLHGKLLIQHAVDTIGELEWQSRFAVVAPGKPELTRVLDVAGFKVVTTDAPPHGMGFSIAKAAAAALEKPAQALLICLGDMPFVTAETLQRLIASLAVDSSRTIAVCGDLAAGRMTPPVLFRRCHFEELSQLGGDSGAKSLIQRYRNDVVAIPLPAGQYMDFDNKADFRQA